MRTLTNDDLLGRLSALVAQERESLADIVEHLMEVDRREIVIDRGYPSLFVYCVKALGYSEAESYLRIRAARAAREFPRLLGDLRTGRLRLDAVARLFPHLTVENSAELLDRAAGASKREVMTIVAQLGAEPAPERDVVLPVSSTPAPAMADVPHVISPPQHRFHFTADQELVDLVERLRQLLRHKYPEGRLESIFTEAARALLGRIDPGRSRPSAAEQQRPRKRKRAVPESVKRQVWERDGGRCAYVSEDGRRCESRDAIEFDHVLPWALGGDSDSMGNIRLLCRAHNQRLARRRFGPRDGKRRRP
jgi:hypothetical protein